MASGFFFGGMAPGIMQGANAISNDMKLQSLMQLQVAQSQNNQKHADFMKLRADAVQHLDDTITQLKIAHPELSPMQLASNPAVVSLKDMIGGFDKNLKLPSTIDSIVASLAERPSQAETVGALARAKEGPLATEFKQSEIEKNRALARSYPDLSENPDAPGLPANSPALGNKRSENSATFNQRFSQTSQSDVSEEQKYGGTKYIKTPFTNRQKAIIGYAGATPEQFDFDATMYAYGNTNVTQGYRSYHGVNPVTVMRARAAQYWMDKFPGEMGPQQANAVMTEFKAMQHGANTAASIDARMTQALAKAENTASILTQPGKNGKSLIDSVDRTQYKDLNDFLVNWRGRTGNQPEIRLAIALETLASNYGVSLGMGNSQLTDFQVQRAQGMLQKGWASGQLQAAVDQLQQEMTREEAGTRQGMQRFIGGMQSTMGTNPGQTPGQSNAPPPPPAGFNVLGQ